MPRRGENIYKRKDGRWEGRVLRPGGRYQYVYAKTYKEVREKKKALMENADKQTLEGMAGPCHADKAFTTWLNGTLVSRVKPSTYESYYQCITNYVIPFYKECKYDSITSQSAAEFSDKIKNNLSLSISYRRKILTIFKTALRELLKGTGEYELTLSAISMPRAEYPEIQVFSLREQRAVENAIIQHPNKQALGLLLCFYTGVRLGEICGLRWSDIDLEARTLSISRTVYRVKNFDAASVKTAIFIGIPKTPKAIRKIPIPGFLIDMAQELGVKFSGDNRFVLSGTENPMDPRRYQKLFKTILKNAKVTARKFHAMRHTFATRALELGVDIKTLSEILGHTNVTITLNIYAHSMFEQKKKAIQRLNDMYIGNQDTAAFAVTKSVTHI